jgi:hypothetical protein
MKTLTHFDLVFFVFVRFRVYFPFFSLFFFFGVWPISYYLVVVQAKKIGTISTMNPFVERERDVLKTCATQVTCQIVVL